MAAGVRGSIKERKLKDGSSSWVLMYRVGGRLIKQTVRGSQTDAERVLTAALAARDRGEIRAPDTERFEPYAARWLESKQARIEPSTWNDYSAHVTLRLVPAFGKLKLRQITRSRIEAFLAELDAKIFPDDHKRKGERMLRRKTINGSLIPLRGVLDRAVQDGIIPANPARGRGIELADETPEMRYLTRADVAAYLKACSKEYRPLAELLISTGLRLGEALGLEWRDVDFDASSLRVTRARKRSGIGSTKTDRPRVVYVDKGLLAMLKKHRRSSGRAHGLIFTTSIGTPLNDANVRNRWHAPAVKTAGLDPALRVHDLRHTYGTLTTASGAGMHFAGQQLGHRDPRSTMRYLHVDPEAHREAAEKAAAWRRRQSVG